MLVEQWGGNVPSVEVSARNKTNIDELLEIILLVADIEEVKANPNKPAVGTIIESNRDKNRGVVSTVLVQNGTLRVDDVVVVGATYGKIRAMFSDSGKRLRHAEPSSPVEILGLNDVPKAGDILQVLADIALARDASSQRLRQVQIDAMASQMKSIGLEDLVQPDPGWPGQRSECDPEGRCSRFDRRDRAWARADQHQAFRGPDQGAPYRYGRDHRVGCQPGDGVERDHHRLQRSARPGRPAAGGSERHRYPLLSDYLPVSRDLEKAMVGMLAPVQREVIDGFAEVRNTFRLPTRDTVAGLYVTDGKVNRNSRVRVLRSGVVVHDGRISVPQALQRRCARGPDGYECGLVVEGFGEVQNGDMMEFYHKEKVERTAYRRRAV